MMIEISVHDAALIGEISDVFNVSNEVLEIKDKYYIDGLTLFQYLDDVYKEYVEQQQKIETLQNMMNEDHYDRYYELGGFPL